MRLMLSAWTLRMCCASLAWKLPISLSFDQVHKIGLGTVLERF